MLKWFEKLLLIKSNKEKVSVCNKTIDDLFDSLNETIIDIRVGSDLVRFDESIFELFWKLREEIKSECGFIIPEVRLREDFSYQENEFGIYVYNQKVHEGFAIPSHDECCDEIYEALKTVIYDNLDKVFTNELAEKYVNTVMKSNNILVWDITNKLSIIDIKTILTEIIMKGKSINNISYIFEKMGEYILSDGICPYSNKKYNPHIISQAISRYLYK